MISFVCIIVPARRFFQLADRHLFWVVTSAWHLGVEGGAGAWWRCHGVGMPPGVWILWWGKGSGSGGVTGNIFGTQDIQCMVMEAVGDRPIGLAIYTLF